MKTLARVFAMARAAVFLALLLSGAPRPGYAACPDPCPATPCPTYTNVTGIENTLITRQGQDVTGQTLCIQKPASPPTGYESYTAEDWADYFGLSASSGHDIDRKKRYWYEQDENCVCHLKNESTDEEDSVKRTWSGSVDILQATTYTLTCQWDDEPWTDEYNCTHRYDDTPVTRSVTICLYEIRYATGETPTGGKITKPEHEWLNGPAPYRYDDQGVTSDTPGWYDVWLTGEWDPPWEDVDHRWKWPCCGYEVVYDERFESGFSWEQEGGSGSFIYSPPPWWNSVAYRPGNEVGPVTIRLKLRDKPNWPDADDPDVPATGDPNTWTLTIFQDHLARDIANFNGKEDNPHHQLGLCDSEDDQSTWNCEQASHHAYNGVYSNVKFFLGWAHSDPLNAPYSQENNPGVTIGRGDVVYFTNGVNHVATSVGGYSIWSANNVPDTGGQCDAPGELENDFGICSIQDKASRFTSEVFEVFVYYKQ